MPLGHIFLTFWLPTWSLEGGGVHQVMFFSFFFNFGQSWNQNGSQGAPKSPWNHPRPPFLAIFEVFLTDY